MDEGEGDERLENGVEFAEAGEDPSVASQSSEQSFDLVAFLVDLLVVIPTGPGG